MMRRFFDRRVSSLGLTSAQWKMILRLAREPGLKQVELADRLDIEPITAGRTIDRLEEAGYVERQPDPDDRRAWRLFLTAKAEPLVAKLRALAEQLTGEAFEGFEAGEITTLRANLARIRDNIARAETAIRESA